MRQAPLPALLLLSLLFAASCSQEKDDGIVPNLLVGIAHVCDSRFEPFNKVLEANIRIALELHSTHGVVEAAQGPVRIQFLTMPIARKKGMPRRIFYETASNYGLKAVVGNLCTLTDIEIAAAAELLHIPFMPPVAAAPEVTDGHVFTFPTSPLIVDKARTYAAFLRNTLKVRKVGLLAKDDALSDLILIDELNAYFRDNGGEPASVRYFKSAADIPGLLPGLIADGVQAVLSCPVAPHVFDIGRELDALGFQGPLLGAYSEQGFRYARHLPMPKLPVYFLSFWNPDALDPDKKRYIAAFTASQGGPPSEDDAFVYDTVVRLIGAVKTAKSLSSQGLHTALMTQSDFSGAMGQYAFSGAPRLDGLWLLRFEDGMRSIDKLSLEAKNERPAMAKRN